MYFIDYLLLENQTKMLIKQIIFHCADKITAHYKPFPQGICCYEIFAERRPQRRFLSWALRTAGLCWAGWGWGPQSQYSLEGLWVWRQAVQELKGSSSSEGALETPEEKYLNKHKTTQILGKLIISIYVLTILITLHFFIIFN